VKLTIFILWIIFVASMVVIPLIAVFQGGPTGYIAYETLAFWIVLAFQTVALFITLYIRKQSDEETVKLSESNHTETNNAEIDDNFEFHNSQKVSFFSKCF